MSLLSSSQFGVFVVDGYNLLSAKIKDFSHEVEVELEPSDGLGDLWRATVPTGMRKATITQGGAFFDTTTAGIHDAMKAAPSTVRLVAWAFAGNVIGAIFTAVQGAFSIKYAPLSTVGKLTKANVSYQVSGQLDEGVILQSATAKTIDWNTKTDGVSVDYALDATQRVIPITSNTLANPTVVTTPVPHGLASTDVIVVSGSNSTPSINGSQVVTVTGATTFTVPVNVSVAGTAGTFVRGNTKLGGVGYQFVSALSGFSGFIGKIRSSPDDVTYADLLTFTNVTAAPAAERLTVAGTIDRYLSFNGDVTGAGSITPFVGFKRN
jgi:hypothetical protein